MAGLLETAILGGFTESLKPSLLSLVTGSGESLGWIKRKLIREALPGLIRSGLSTNEMLSGLRSVGAGIRRQDFLRMTRYNRPVVTAQDYVEGLPSSEIIDTSIAHHSPIHYGKGYWAEVQVYGRGYDGRYTSHPYYVKVTEGMTTAEVEELAADNISEMLQDERYMMLIELRRVKMTDLVYSE